MGYILKDNAEEGCFLCNAGSSKDDRACLVIHRGPHCLCMLNRYPYNNGHVLVAPYAHKADFADLDEAESVDIMKAIAEVQRRIREVMKPDGFNIGVNIGRISGAGLPGHLHFHIVPRWQGDTNFMPVLSDTKVIPQALQEVYDLLKRR